MSPSHQPPERSHVRVVLAVALTALAALTVGWWAAPIDALPAPTVASVAAPSAPSAPASAPPLPVVQLPVPLAALPDCPHQALDITTSAGPERGCVSVTQTRQSGSVRTFLLDPEGVSTWRLAVDAIGPRVLSVRLHRAPVGREPETLYVCDGSACAGTSFGDPDAHGARQLKLFATPLRALPAGKRWTRPRPGSASRPHASDAASAVAGVALASVRLSAILKVEADRIDASLDCPDGGLQAVENGGAVIRFCALGGSGFDVGEDRQVRFSFRDLEGRQLVVALGQDRTSIASVSFGDLACRSPMCGGASVRADGDAADPSVARRFTFSGVTLVAAESGKRSATLNGGLTLAAQ